MNRLFILLIICVFISCGDKKENHLQIHNFNELDWKFYAYNAYMGKQKIPVLAADGMEIIDTINLFQTLFQQEIRPYYGDNDTSKINVFFSPINTTRKYMPTYVNSLHKHRDSDEIRMIYIKDRNTYNITPERDSMAMVSFKEYLVKHKDAVHPLLLKEAQKRGVLPHSSNSEDLPKE